MPVTIKQIARHLKVSPVTVSKGLNNTGRLSPVTRQRVLRTATRLGYRPNAAARAMVSGRFNQIGLLLGMDGTRSHLPGDLLYGVHDALMEHGIHLTISRLTDEQLSSEGFIPMILKQTAADGLLVNYRTAIPGSLIKLIREHAIPSIWIESAQSSDGVDIDHVDAAAQLTRHLLELGHKQIAYADHHPADDNELTATTIDGRMGFHHSIIDRRRGYAREMRSAALPPRFIHRPPLPGGAYRERVDIAKEWLSQPDRPTAVVAYVSATAWPILMAAQSLGIRVPEDLSVTTFGDATLPGFRATEMRLPEREIGQEAVRMLLKKVDDPSRVLPSVCLKATLITGMTSGPPPARGFVSRSRR